MNRTTLTALAALGLLLILALPAAAQDDDTDAGSTHAQRVQVLKEEIAVAIRDHDEVALLNTHERLQSEYESQDRVLAARAQTSDVDPQS